MGHPFMALQSKLYQAAKKNQPDSPLTGSTGWKNRDLGFGAWVLENNALTTVIRFN